MIKTLWKVVLHTYWEHYGARPSETVYETKEEAQKRAQEFLEFNFYEDGYYANVYPYTKVEITPEEAALSKKRKADAKALEKAIYNSLHLVDGIWYHWDGSFEPVYANPECDDDTCFMCKDGFKISQANLDYGEKIYMRDRVLNSYKQNPTKFFNNLVLLDKALEEEDWNLLY